MLDSRVRMIVLVAGLFVWYAAIRTSWQVGHSIAGGGDVDSLTADVSATYVNPAVQKALEPRTALEPKQFRGKPGMPFLPTGRPARRTREVRAQPKAPERVKLYLNGVLLRSSKPQAILEDEQGRTFILGVGDSVHSQQVVKIGPDQVTMRHGRSTFPIKVRE
ncbi:MAG: hypothetical protein GF331_19405 [Chitinivibrionales bacterium]|nr:hypothetical protein [Chitinivibrionales bacterium]